LLCLFEGFDELRQSADRAVLDDTLFAANLALHFAFAEGVRALGSGTSAQHPAENRVMLCRRSLRVSQAEQVAVRPAIALLILYRLARKFISLAANIPATDGIAQTTAPAAQSIYILREVEQVRADAADLAQLLEG